MFLFNYIFDTSLLTRQRLCLLIALLTSAWYPQKTFRCGGWKNASRTDLQISDGLTGKRPSLSFASLDCILGPSTLSDWTTAHFTLSPASVHSFAIQKMYTGCSSQGLRWVPSQTFTRVRFLICLQYEGLGLDGVCDLISSTLSLRLNRWPTGSCGRDNGISHPVDHSSVKSGARLALLHWFLYSKAAPTWTSFFFLNFLFSINI